MITRHHLAGFVVGAYVAMLGDAVWAHFSVGWLFYVGGFGFAALIALSVLLDEGK